MTSRRWLPCANRLAAALALALAVGCGQPPQVTRLPWFDGPDLTPRWDVSAKGPIHTIDPFAFVDQTGARLSQSDLDGKVYVASFLFTRCSGICPTMVRNLRLIQDAYQDDPRVLLLSHSVTPTEDTVDVLAAYGTAQRIDPGKWRLVTGDRDEIYRLARTSYYADDLGDNDPNDNDDNDPNDNDPGQGRPTGSTDFLHTENALLVDGQRRIRGIYNATDRNDMTRLIEDIATLLDAG